jgi:SnoaL-like polyketide cyclase
VSGELERGRLEELADHWRAAWETGGFEACCTPDVGYEDPVTVEPRRGAEALEELAASVRGAFPDLRLEATSPPLGRDGFACLPWRAVGTNAADIGTLLPATHRFVSLHGLHYVELSDGLVRRARGFFDLYDAAVQLGLLPSRGGLGETALLLMRGFGLRRPPQPPAP